jgi:hypothetical protein
MFQRLKNLIRPPAPAGAAEYVHSLSAEARSTLQAEVRHLLRDVVHADEFPLLAQLGQTARKDFSSIHIPVNVLPKLAREIDTVRHKLPPKSPLVGLAESARKCRGMDLVLASAAPAARAGETADFAGVPPVAPSISAVEQLELLKTAAAEVDVSYSSTLELGDPALAGYFKYCLGLGEYDKIISALGPRVAEEPRVWSYSLLVAAMRLSNHADFTATVARFHAWLEVAHPEALNDMTSSEDRRKFNGEKIAEIEALELPQH